MYSSKAHFTTIRNNRPISSHHVCCAVDDNTKSTTTTPTRPIKEQTSNIIIQGIVSLATETLRLIGVGAKEYQEQVTAEESSPTLPPLPPLPPGDIDGILHLLTLDYQRAYFVTGSLEDRIYTEDCYFADPTVQFRGRELWKRNLKLLTPFLIEPSIQLLRSIVIEGGEGEEVGSSSNLQQQPSSSSSSLNGGVQFVASWKLKTGLKLPWQPYIDIEGTTRYVLNEEKNAICQHIEAWNITGFEALLIVFTPGKKSKKEI